MRIPTRLLACVLLSLPLVHGGCASSPWSEKRVTVLVIDAETERPILRAAVTLDYSNDASPSRHVNIRRETDYDGQALIFAAVARGNKAALAPQWRVEANGYVTYWVD